MIWIILVSMGLAVFLLACAPLTGGALPKEENSGHADYAAAILELGGQAQNDKTQQRSAQAALLKHAAKSQMCGETPPPWPRAASLVVMAILLVAAAIIYHAAGAPHLVQ